MEEVKLTYEQLVMLLDQASARCMTLESQATALEWDLKTAVSNLYAQYTKGYGDGYNDGVAECPASYP